MKTTNRLRCAADHCPEVGFFDYDSRRDADKHAADMRRQGGWRCTRHTRPNEVLTPENADRTIVLVADKSPNHPHLDSLFWVENGERVHSGFEHGPGFKAWAKDFPRGTRLVVTARLEFPTTPGSDQSSTEQEEA